MWSDQVDFYRSQLKVKLQLRWAQTFVTLQFDLLFFGRLPVTVFQIIKWTGNSNTSNCFRESNELIITMSLWQHHDFICVRKFYIYIYFDVGGFLTHGSIDPSLQFHERLWAQRKSRGLQEFVLWSIKICLIASHLLNSDCRSFSVLKPWPVACHKLPLGLALPSI